MSRFRYPIRAIREPFGTAGLVVAIVALIAALAGGAIAATGGSGGNRATASAKKSKQGKQGPRGKTGPAGPAGLTGPAGPQGATGATGATGAQGERGLQGEKGEKGDQGESGSSVTGTVFAGEKDGCTEGGVEFVAGGNITAACNGEKGAAGSPGAQGPQGPAGPLVEALPSGKTLRGLWAASGFQPTKESRAAETAVSFPFPVENAAGEGPIVNYIPVGGTTPTGCTGDVEEPGAVAGNLCIFALKEEKMLKEAFTLGYPEICNWSTSKSTCYPHAIEGKAELKHGSPYGFGLRGFSEGYESGLTAMVGTWAVTAE